MVHVVIWSCIFRISNELTFISLRLARFIYRLSQIDMECTTHFILELYLLCACFCLGWGQGCPPQKQTSVKFTVISQRNQTGHWISQVTRRTETAKVFQSLACLFHGSEAFPEKLTCPQIVMEFPVFYGTRRFITLFTRAFHLSVSCARSMQSMPSETTFRGSILILFSQYQSQGTDLCSSLSKFAFIWYNLTNSYAPFRADNQASFRTRI
jgi:hypothetical protein